jgi:putative phage-type endonuclease
MIVFDHVEQGTDEWHEIRRGVITASRFKDVMSKGRGDAPSKTRQSYMLELAAESVTGEVEHFEPNKYMKWGTEKEPEAKSMYELITDNEVAEVAFIKHDTLNCGVSPDGLINADGGLEIKCPKTTTQIETFLSGKMPSQHKAQVQGCMWVTEREWWDFVSFDPRIVGESSFFTVRVERDEDYIANLAEQISLFDSELQSLINKLKG